ncbi:MAG: NADH-quinone oxidoreductase subunit D [Caldilineales bacterium]|nr:NADH-quinone oxidoreductase subunit D [Caldilineales bacterium]
MTDAVTEAPVVETAPLPFAEAVPGAVVAADDSGIVVARDKLVEFTLHLRNKEGFNYLSSLTAVDYLGFEERVAADRFEVVYHLFDTKKGGDGIVLKVRLPENDPQVDSLIKVYPGADLQEREVYDLFGIRFNGHPRLRRIFLWEGFNGYPMRKDWKEAYYEEDHKPFGSRWPIGHYQWGEDRVPWGDNVNYPKGWNPESFEPAPPPMPHIYDIPGETFKTERIVVNMGPQHPSTHGVFRMIVALDGETVVGLEPECGYLHRNHEKIGERNTWLGNIPFTDRLDYLSSMSNNFGYVLAVEKLMGDKGKPPERAEYIRVIMAELTRICNHVWSIGFLLNDLGAFFTPALYTIIERELILDLFEEAAGSRMLCNYMRFGGVARDVDDDWLARCRDIVFNRLPKKIDEFDRYLTENEILMSRCVDVGYLSPEDAVALSVCGPMLRGSGINYDVRRARPYSIYDRFKFDVVTDDGCDVYARYKVRLGEVRESVRILKQALDDIPGGDIMNGKPAYVTRVEKGEAYGAVEGPKGELGFYVVSDGSDNAWRYHVRAPSYINLNALGPMSIGYKIADSVVILGAIDIVLGETDR